MILFAWLLAAPPPTHAVFWDPHGRTWQVDLAAATLTVADAWLVPEAGGLRRVRRQVSVHAGRDVARLPAPASRWTRFEQRPATGGPWLPLSAAPELPAPGEARLEDERIVLQFLGDQLSAVRFRRVDAAGAELSRRFEVETVALAPGVAPPPEAAAGGGPCQETPVGVVVLEGPGGARLPWAVATGGDEACQDVAKARPLQGAPPLARDRGPRWEDLADLRPGPGGFALALRGRPLPTETLDVAAGLESPCTQRMAWLLRPQGPPAPLGRVGRLDGLRWLGAQDPLVQAAAHWFRDPLAGCHRGLPVPVRGLRVGHHCRVDEADGRPWEGPEDLSASLHAAFEGRDLVIEIEIQDPRVEPDDRLVIWAGGGRPVRASLNARGLTVSGGAAARRKVGGGLRGTWSRGKAGPRVELRLARALLGEPPALSLAFEDGPEAERRILWLAGQPLDRRQTAATPLELRR